jgi:hypothetical protein
VGMRRSSDENCARAAEVIVPSANIRMAAATMGRRARRGHAGVRVGCTPLASEPRRMIPQRLDGEPDGRSCRCQDEPTVRGSLGTSVPGGQIAERTGGWWALRQDRHPCLPDARRGGPAFTSLRAKARVAERCAEIAPEVKCRRLAMCFREEPSRGAWLDAAVRGADGWMMSAPMVEVRRAPK